MKKIIFLFLFFFTVAGINAQSSKELVGKWQLVKQTKDGVDKDLKEQFKTDQVFQTFYEDGKFVGIVGDKSTKGKWKLSKESKELTITVDMVPVKFTVDYLDSKKRIISHKQVGTLEYKKISD